MRIDDVPLERRSSVWGMAAAAAILANVIATAVKETYAPFKHAMTLAFGHHWVAQAVSVLAVYVVLGLLFDRTRLAGRIPPMRLVALLVATTLAAGFGLLVLFALAA